MLSEADEELKRIDESEEYGSGKESYSFAINIPRRPKDIKYICPKFWDISKSLSIRPDAVNRSDVVPTKVKSPDGKTDKFILERSPSILNVIEDFKKKNWQVVIEKTSAELQAYPYNLDFLLLISLCGLPSSVVMLPRYFASFISITGFKTL